MTTDKILILKFILQGDNENEENDKEYYGIYPKYAILNIQLFNFLFSLNFILNWFSSMLLLRISNKVYQIVNFNSHLDISQIEIWIIFQLIIFN